MTIDYKGYLIEYETIPQQLLGGQSVSPIHQDLKVVVKDLGIDMTVTTFRSNVKNRDLSIKIIDLIISEITEDFNKQYK